ncbi:unnamed protein product [Strongylus vulgaris]|uniref:Uncharacterized protein n=1 Tax=Strongylus vulgaris TaxID=40348 RepID=A0A3P7IJD9_STRVU|nr:unnamed protein product [Strongylus vulgaris]
MFDKRQKKGEIGEAELVGQSKKMWVLADLGMLMLVYRGKVTIRNEPRKTLLSTRFFIREKNSKHAGTVYAPHELIEDEKERNGKLPTRDRKRLNSTSSLVLSKRKTQKGRVALVKTCKVEESPKSPEEIVNKSPARKKVNRKPLKVEQESVVVTSKEELKSPRLLGKERRVFKHLVSEDDDTSPSTSGEQMQTRSSQNRKEEETTSTKAVTPIKRTTRNTTPLKRTSANEDALPLENGDAKVALLFDFPSFFF